MEDKLLPKAAEILRSQALECADFPPRWSLPLAQARAQTLQMSRRWNRKLPEMAMTTELEINGRSGRPIHTRLFVPNEANGSLILYIHGGGWTVGDIDTHESTTRHLAIQCRSAVLSCNYRLAPEHPFPAGLEDCLDVWRAVAAGIPDTDHKITGPLAIAGDSSGANLAFSVMLHELEKNLPTPEFGILFYGAFGCNFSTASYKAFSDGPGLTKADMEQFWNWYLPNVSDRTNALAVSLKADDEALRRLPPLYLGAAGIDPLLSENQQMRDRLTALGRLDVWREYAGVPHGFIQMNAELPTAMSAIEDAGEAFRGHKSLFSTPNSK